MASYLNTLKAGFKSHQYQILFYVRAMKSRKLLKQPYIHYRTCFLLQLYPFGSQFMLKCRWIFFSHFFSYVTRGTQLITDLALKNSYIVIYCYLIYHKIHLLELIRCTIQLRIWSRIIIFLKVAGAAQNIYLIHLFLHPSQRTLDFILLCTKINLHRDFYSTYWFRRICCTI